MASDWLEDAEIYSLHDLTRVNSGELLPLLRAVVCRGTEHVTNCEVIRNFVFIVPTIGGNLARCIGVGVLIAVVQGARISVRKMRVVRCDLSIPSRVGNTVP